jgi:hypothetical protein
MPDRNSYDYAIIRVVPRVERGERVNVGVILFCRTRDFLDVEVDLDRARLLAIAPDLDLDAVQRQLDMITLTCQGSPAAGSLGQMSRAERFHWLVSPRSTIVQTSAVHCGLCADPARALQRLFARLVAVPLGEHDALKRS